MKAPKPMKAYAVLEDTENTGGIVFARHSIVALREGACRFGDGDICGWTARRAQWADQFVDSEQVPASVCIDHGWNFECCGCGARIDSGWLDENEKPVDGVIGDQDTRVFCCTECLDQFNLCEERLAAARNDGLGMLREIVMKRFPDAKLGKSHAYARNYNGRALFEEGCVYFDFPGQKIGPASINFRRSSYNMIGPINPVFYCCSGDKEAFEAYVRSTKEGK